MRIEEVHAVVRMVAANCPSQKIDEFTAQAWHLPLADIDVKDALVAVGEMAKTYEWIAPRDIVAKVGQMRAARVQQRHIPAPVNPDNTRDYRRQLLRLIDGMAAGRDPDARLGLDAGERDQAVPAGEVEAFRQVRARLGEGGRDAEFAHRRAESLKHQCPICAEPPGAVCVSESGRPLVHSPAHPARLVLAGLDTPTPVYDTEHLNRVLGEPSNPGRTA